MPQVGDTSKMHSAPHSVLAHERDIQQHPQHHLSHDRHHQFATQLAAIASPLSNASPRALSDPNSPASSRSTVLRIAIALLVIFVWLAASLNAPAANAAAITLATVSQTSVNGKTDVKLSYQSDITNAIIHVHVNGKRWGVVMPPSGAFTIAGLANGNYKFRARSSGEGAVWSNEIAITIGAGPLPVVSAAKRDAARLLLQASFGPRTMADIDDVATRGNAAWIDAQFTQPWPSHADYLSRVAASGEKVEEQHVFESIWQQLIWGDARLRARVALALSEIMVISNIAPDQNNDALMSWMDMLYRNAFGNYRTLLQEVTLHPAMGYYLNMLGNDKEDPAVGRMPNENYAREVQQLFSIGLVELNPDGTPRRDAAGKTIPTYDQSVVQGFAAAFTGWNFAGNDTSKADTFDDPQENWTQPMRAWPSRHSTGAKKLLSGVALPAGQTPEKDLADALDVIANHPNVGPFMSKRLIQFLVTSNPSPAYVARIANVWSNNGQNVRGDLKAVVRAILLDPEARTDVSASSNTSYGKVREPMVKFVHFLNAMGAKSKNNRNSIWWLDSPDDYLGQSPLLAASVFNFFSPSYTRAGPIAQAGLVAPEMQIVTDTQIVGSSNFFHRMINDHGFGFKDEGRVEFDFAQFDSVAGDTNALLDRVNWLFFAGGMTQTTRDIMARAVNKVAATDAHRRAEIALMLATMSPEFVIQK
jgi:endo-chitodextinase